MTALAIGCCGAGLAQAADSLLEVAEAGNSAAAMALVAAQADVNAHQDDGTSALHWAAYHDDLPLMGQLLKAGANANFKTPDGETPLMAAARSGKVDAAIAVSVVIN